MFTPKTFPRNIKQNAFALPEAFSLLIWNIHKENQQAAFQAKLSTLLANKPYELLLFQEVKYQKASPYVLENYCYAVASNIETVNNIFGVLTASQVGFEKIDTLLTDYKELGIATRKSLLLTQHKLSNGKVLHVVNLHAINFVSSNIFKQALSKIQKKLFGCAGPMIVAGDFNNWNLQRVNALHKFQLELGLKKALIESQQHIKKVFDKPLDHLYYRDLTLLKSEAIDTQNISDHNPIYATFKT